MFVARPAFCLVATLPNVCSTIGVQQVNGFRPSAHGTPALRRVALQCQLGEVQYDNGYIHSTNMRLSGVEETGDRFTKNEMEGDASDGEQAGGEGGISGGDGDGGGGGGGGQKNDGNKDGDDAYESLPNDMQLALAYGSLTRDGLTQYFKWIRNPLMRMMMNVRAFRSRALADQTFLFKLVVQEIVGNGTALLSELAVRGKDIVDELEYVASDLIVGTVVEAAFVWCLAPTLQIPTSKTWLSKYISSLPSNMFQPSSALQTFRLSQRAMSFVYGGVQYAAIGFAAGIIGTGITYALIETRKRLDKMYAPERPLPDVLSNSAAWAAFMMASSNTRFQLVEGLELGIARTFAGSASGVVNGGIIALRLLNNYWGGVQFVQFFRFLGLHATGEPQQA